MARVKIVVPEQWVFRTEMPVRITDVNYGGHVGNDTMLSYLQEARVRWLRSMGYPSELLAAPVGLILVDLAVRLKTEVVYGDTIEARLAVAEWTRLGFELVYQMIRASDGAEIARATTGFTFFDYTARALAPSPAGFRERAGALPAGAPRP